MLSNSCRYGIRAIIYIASRKEKKSKTGLIQISKDLGLPAPFLAKILQQLVRQKILNSSKGPHGGFALQRKAEEISLYDIITIIDGDGLFTDCLIHSSKCGEVNDEEMECPLHDNFSEIRNRILLLFKTTTIDDLVKKAVDINKIII